MLEPEITETKAGAAARITLNRPKALNALTRGMVQRMSRVLSEWEADPAVTLIVVDAVGGRAFCAGGDVARLYAEGTAGNFAYCTGFWAENYALNAQIAELGTPYVALMDGIVMGGGAGISAHGRHRVVTERTVLAMPECGIGLVPDVGASHLLARAPEGLARLVALTGVRLGAADCIALGLADSFVPSDRLPALVGALMEAADAGPIAQFSTPPGPGTLPDPEDAAAMVAGPSPAALAARLERRPEAWALDAAAALRRASPRSLRLTLDLLDAARHCPSLRRCLERDLDATSYCLTEGDFLEGVRAAIIDKDRKPNWKPDTCPRPDPGP